MIRELSRKVSKAQKRHRCNCCAQFIEAKELYIAAFVVDENTREGWMWKSHIDCDQLLNIFLNESGEVEIDSEDFRTEIQERYYQLTNCGIHSLPRIPFTKMLESIKELLLKKS